MGMRLLLVLIAIWSFKCFCVLASTGARQVADVGPMAVARQISGPGQMTDVGASINFPQTGTFHSYMHDIQRSVADQC